MIDRSQWARRSVTHLMHQAEQAAEKLFIASARGSVTPRQFAILVAISEDEGLNQTAVMERTGVDHATSATIIKYLVRKGLLQRRRSREDTRAKLLRLTDEGRRLLEAVDPMARNADALLLAVLPPARREPFLAALQAIVRVLEERSC